MVYESVKWCAMGADEPYPRMTGDMITDIPRWMMARGSGEQVAQQLCEIYFTLQVWNQEFGQDATHAYIRVMISDPEPMIGNYLVTMNRLIEANARKVNLYTK